MNNPNNALERAIRRALIGLHINLVQNVTICNLKGHAYFVSLDDNDKIKIELVSRRNYSNTIIYCNENNAENMSKIAMGARIQHLMFANKHAALITPTMVMEAMHDACEAVAEEFWGGKDQYQVIDTEVASDLFEKTLEEQTQRRTQQRKKRRLNDESSSSSSEEEDWDYENDVPIIPEGEEWTWKDFARDFYHQGFTNVFFHTATRTVRVEEAADSEGSELKSVSKVTGECCFTEDLEQMIEEKFDKALYVRVSAKRTAIQKTLLFTTLLEGNVDQKDIGDEMLRVFSFLI